MGHNGLLFCTGIWLVIKGEMLRFSAPTNFAARYMIMRLGIFATFAGFMHNDFFSIGLAIFNSRWANTDGDGIFEPINDVTNSGGALPYPFGMGWRWVDAAKSPMMKLSVLFDVLQMVVGMLLRWNNKLKEKT